MSPDDIETLVGEVVKPKPKPVRLLFYDIETAPMLAFIWQSKTDWIPPSMIESEKFMLSWSAKWSDETRVHSQVVTSKEAKVQDDSRIVIGLSKLLRKAGYAVAHNGDRFDLPTVNGRLLLNNLPPLGSVQTIDTLKIARQSFNLTSNKLDYLAQRLGFGEKHHTSFDLWRRCFYGETAALKQMRDYNMQDSVLLEHVFHALRPYAKRLPRLIDAVEWRQEMCPYCGSSDRQPGENPYHRTKVNTFPKWRCDECGREYYGFQAIGSKKSGSIGL